MRNSFVIFLLLFFASGSVLGIEKVGPKETQKRETSDLGTFSLKPLKIYSPRGRRDPFISVRYALTNTARAETSEFTISRLKLVGFIGIGKYRFAVFQLRGSFLTYTLKSGRLYEESGRRVKKVKGRLLKSGDVELQQGERKLVFKKFREN